MRVSIRDPDALRAVSPTALSAYARAAGWRRHEPYRARSDVYVGEDRPEIIVPRTDRLGDYASVVAGLIDVFAQVVRQDELAVYRSSGVSANLCEALARIISSFPTLGVGVSWARTRPVTGVGWFQRAVRFGRADAPLLREAARLLREV